MICLRLKNIFFHLFEKPADDVTWLRIKQSGTYTIHFELFPFLFKLHTRDDISLNTIQNIILIWRRMNAAF